MTGATLITVKGNKGWIGKVRCDGFLLLDFLKKADVFVALAPETLFEAFIAKAGSSFSYGPKTSHEFTHEPHSHPVWLAEDILHLEDRVIGALAEDHFLRCSYADYFYFVDFDSKTIQRIVDFGTSPRSEYLTKQPPASVEPATGGRTSAEIDAMQDALNALHLTWLETIPMEDLNTITQALADWRHNRLEKAAWIELRRREAMDR